MKKSILFAVLMAFNFMLNAQSTTSPKVTLVSDDPTIYVTESTIDYGTIEKGSDPFRKVVVLNRGKKPLLIQNCKGSCGCTVPKCPKEPIMPGELSEISVRYDTNRVGPFTKSVSIQSNDPKHAMTHLTIKGVVTKPTPTTTN